MKVLKHLFFVFILTFLNQSGRAEPGRNIQADDARRAYLSALKQRSMYNMVKSLIMLGDVQKEKNFDSAYLNYSYALKLADRFGLVKFRPRIFFETGMLHIKAGNFKMAVELFDSARYSASRMGDDTIVSNVLNMLGTLYVDICEMPQAKSMFEESYKLAMEKHLPRQAGAALGNIAQFIHDPDSSVRVMKTAITLINTEPGQKKELALIYINIGNMMANSDSAIYYYQKAIHPDEEVSDPTVVMQACNNMAYSYIDKGLAAKANEILQFMAIPIALSDSNFDWLATLYDTWSDVKAYQHDFKGAFNLEKKAVKARGQAESRKSAEQVRLLVLLLEVKKKDVLFSHAQRRVTSQNNDIRSLKLIVFSLVIVLLLIAVVVFGYYQRIKINSQRKELDLTKRKIDIQDYERKQLAIQLHDLTGPFDKKMAQKISKLSFPDPLVREECILEWKKISSTIHSISYQLNHNMVKDLPFHDLIVSLVEEYRLLCDLTIEVDLDPGIVIASNQQANLFYIIQELFNNAMKYVKNGIITIKITVEYKNLYLFYQDKGPGFESGSRKKQGMGINNIFERAVLLGGRATLKTSPGQGTRWIVAIPHTTNEEHKYNEAYSIAGH